MHSSIGRVECDGKLPRIRELVAGRGPAVVGWHRGGCSCNRSVQHVEDHRDHEDNYVQPIAVRNFVGRCP